ncbi:fumarylacetoacetase [Helicobacter monodelphidis]|uniref:fumarylacetoacetate hydrolase family protein n=1 Tax=Helicobacter sp. 15-1451 TaxID=2004995 RepID=UPI000DCC19C6|nr:fumarylacetoacetate hydrolase family protein [Helicobacter sp. 15-1451]RAX56870.1 fumarylacetoacetase [Helicobacter sp. 15-1451]
MRFVTFRKKDENQVLSGIEINNRYFSFIDFRLPYRNINEFILYATSSDYESFKYPKGDGLQEDSISLLAPIQEPLQDIICLGINYLDHAEESARFKQEKFEKREYAVYFSKRVNEASGAYSDIPVHADITQQLDYEVELGVILKTGLYKATLKEAKEAIFGYTIINELSARDLQLRHKQWYFGKSLEGCCVMGPCIVSADEFGGEIPNLQIQSFVNGELRQNSQTANMIFDIPSVLVELSSGMRLKAGTILSTGTPKGVGMGFEPPLFLKAGDCVECYIEQIGRTCNRLI